MPGSGDKTASRNAERLSNAEEGINDMSYSAVPSLRVPIHRRFTLAFPNWHSPWRRMYTPCNWLCAKKTSPPDVKYIFTKNNYQLYDRKVGKNLRQEVLACWCGCNYYNRPVFLSICFEWEFLFLYYSRYVFKRFIVLRTALQCFAVYFSWVLELHMSNVKITNKNFHLLLTT